MTITNEIISLCVGIGGFITALITVLTNKTKTTADVQNIVSDTYGDVITMLREQQVINANQITALMQKDTESQKMINQYRNSEKELLKRVKELEQEIEKLKSYNENTTKTPA